MRAELAEHADAPVRVAESDKILAEETHANRRSVALDELLGEQRRHPVAPHQRAHRRIALNAAEQLVFLTGQHGRSLQSSGRG